MKVSLKKVFADVRAQLDQVEKIVADIDFDFEHDVAEAVGADASPPADGETVTTRREETRPDGTRVVTTVTRTKTVVVKVKESKT